MHIFLIFVSCALTIHRKFVHGEDKEWKKIFHEKLLPKAMKELNASLYFPDGVTGPSNQEFKVGDQPQKWGRVGKVLCSFQKWIADGKKYCKCNYLSHFL